MNDDVIDDCAPGSDFAHKGFGSVRFLPENVKGQGAWAGIDERNCLLAGVIGKDGEHRPKDLFLHDVRLERNPAEQGGGNETIFFAESAPGFDACAVSSRGFNEFLHSPEVVAIDDPAVVWVVGYVCRWPVSFFDGLASRIDEWSLHVFRQENIIWCDAALPRVETFPPDDLESSIPDVCRSIQNRRRFSAQL